MNNQEITVHKASLQHIIEKTDEYQDRYMAAEKLLAEVAEMNLIQRIFCGKRIWEFLKKQNEL